MNLFDIVVVQPIFNLLVLIYSIIPGADFGIALIILTIIIRFLLWPLVKKQLRQTKIMRKLQPELKKIKKQAKGNKQQEGMQMMALYKKHGVSPFRAIGILLIQLPIFIALYRVIQIFTLHREDIGKYTYDVLENIPIIHQIIENPDVFNEKLLGFINLTEHAVSSNGVNFILVGLALVAAGTQFILSKQTMPHEKTDRRLRDILAEAAKTGGQPDQSEMNAIMMRKMMKFLPIMMFFIMINLPAALALYFAVSNIVAALQQHYILKKDESDLERIASEPTKKEKNAQPAKVVKKKTPSTSRDKLSTETKVTRITAKDDKPRKKS